MAQDLDGRPRCQARLMRRKAQKGMVGGRCASVGRGEQRWIVKVQSGKKCVYLHRPCTVEESCVCVQFSQSQNRRVVAVDVAAVSGSRRWPLPLPTACCHRPKLLQSQLEGSSPSRPGSQWRQVGAGALPGSQSARQSERRCFHATWCRKLAGYAGAACYRQVTRRCTQRVVSRRWEQLASAINKVSGALDCSGRCHPQEPLNIALETSANRPS